MSVCRLCRQKFESSAWCNMTSYCQGGYGGLGKSVGREDSRKGLPLFSRIREEWGSSCQGLLCDVCPLTGELY